MNKLMIIKRITQFTALFFIILGFTLISRQYNSSENKASPDINSQINQDILEFKNNKLKLPAEKETVTLIAVGDVSYSRGVERTVKKLGDFNYPFQKIKGYLQSADMVFGNLESPITAGPEIQDLDLTFRSDPDTAAALKLANFTILSLANNHTPNFGQSGLKDTLKYLRASGIKYVGAGNNEDEAYLPIYIENKNIKFAFLAYNDTDVVPPSYEAGQNHTGTAFMKQEKMMESVTSAKSQADFVIVSMHSGSEYTDNPNKSQTYFARAAIDAGADVIIGHHPHVVQTIEKYRGKYIFYSLGNFIFDQMWSDETKEGLVIKIYFTKREIMKISLIPVESEFLAQPKPASPAKTDKILRRLNFPYQHQLIYVWENNAFIKSTQAIIYAQNPKSSGNVYKKQLADLDLNTVPEKYTLENGVMRIQEESYLKWQSPGNWWVDDFSLADANNDRIVDINISLWKTANNEEPKSDLNIKNHIFIYDYIDGKIKSVWESSTLTNPYCEFKIADIDNDGKNDLIVLEGKYSQKVTCLSNYITVWSWNTRDFVNKWRSETGNYIHLETVIIDGKEYILTDRM